jgi:hypothetical protein
VAIDSYEETHRRESTPSSERPEPVPVAAPATNEPETAYAAPAHAYVTPAEPTPLEEALPVSRAADPVREPVHSPAQPEPVAFRAPALAEAYAMPADLVQVETSHAVPAAEPDEPEQQVRRARRARAPEAAAEAEPLVQIETRPATSQTD